MAKKVISEEDYAEWLTAHNEAKMAHEGRERLLYESYCRLERDLSLLGATGIEDKLQDQGNVKTNPFTNCRVAPPEPCSTNSTYLFNYSTGNNQLVA